ncbi:MAG: SpoIIE family protein phosphatase [Firmicutes bacterium]|nr:SpoIIE family protein phosphatase [Bacillota bacterium]
MARKSEAEKNNPQRRWKSIDVRTFVITLLLTLGIGVTVLVLGLSLYALSSMDEYCVSAWNSANSEAAILEDVDVESKCDEILGIYSGLSDEEKSDPDSPAYLAKFDSVTDEQYQKICNCMLRMKKRNGPLDAYIVAIEKSTGRMICLVDSDSDEELFIPPGWWQPIEKDMADVLINGKEPTPMEKSYGIPEGVQAVVMDSTCVGASTLRKGDEFTILVCVDDDLNRLQAIALTFASQFVLLLLVITILASLIGVLLMRKNLVKPINSLARAAQEYSEDAHKEEGIGNHFANLDIHTGDEIENLAHTMQKMEMDLNDYVDDLTRITAERERITTELSLATRIQASMLPKDFPAFPDRGEFEVYASMEPAREVGGDFYDFFLIDDDHLALVIADVAGKGVPASLFMMASKILLGTETRADLSPAQVLEKVNERICAHNPEDMFVTVWMGVLEISTGRLTSANAGHEHPVRISRGGQAELLQSKHGFVIGGMEGMKYRNEEIQLNPGDKIFVYTDGVPEAESKESGQFGTDRMMDAINEADADADPRQVLKGVHDAVDLFVGEDEQFDDLTMLCLEYRG